MTAPGDALLALWAKTDRSGTHPDAWHPLICHMIDVAAVARAMWREVLTPALRERITMGLGLPNEAAAEAWVTYLASLHDIGKASPAFQSKYSQARPRLTATGLEPSHPDKDPGHGIVSMLSIGPLLEERGIPQPVANALATAVGGHHGIFPASNCFGNPKRPLWCGNTAWNAVRRSLAATLAELIDLPDAAPSRTDHPISMVLAGLISVADWIGSDSESFFHFVDALTLAEPTALNAYQTAATDTAGRALAQLGWLDWTAPVETKAFADLFGFEPRAVQQDVVDLPGVADGPAMVVIELPMGEGKTEAALYLADRWAETTAQRGLYVAMPTMATSNGMFGRLISYLGNRFPAGRVNVQLIHSHAAIAPELEALQHEPPPIDPDGIAASDDEPASVVIEEWFSRRKRGLLAPYGVGTVDQSLMAALQVSHVFVRMFGLAGKTVIFDEVHAYDTYMTTLFERLLEWLGAIGTSVVILTATLPRERRDQLLQAWARGAGYSTAADPAPAPYPRLSWASRAGIGSREVDATTLSSLSRRELRLRWVDVRLPEDGEPFPLGEELREALRDGGCAAVICNTVSRAQQMYQRLQPFFAEGELDLLHARFPFEERDEREKRALTRFGKDSSQRPKRSVLVATQVIEQSLDLDFDLMVTDLAPADHVLQRAGRLQRHVRNRPPGFGDAAVLWIGKPEAMDGAVPRFDAGSEAIYDEHVLLRSWLALKDRATVAFPNDIEENIEAVYDETRECPASDPALVERWEATAEDRRKEQKAEKQQAASKWVLRPTTRRPLWEMTCDPTQEDAPEIHTQLQALTRLALPTVSIVMLWETSQGTSYEPNGRHLASVSSKPNVKEAKRLLGRSLNISHRGVFHDLIAIEPPAAWRESALLRRHRLVLLDADNQCHTKQYTLELDPNLGLLITRKEEA